MDMRCTPLRMLWCVIGCGHIIFCAMGLVISTRFSHHILLFSAFWFWCVDNTYMMTCNCGFTTLVAGIHSYIDTSSQGQFAVHRSMQKSSKYHNDTPKTAICLCRAWRSCRRLAYIYGLWSGNDGSLQVLSNLHCLVTSVGIHGFMLPTPANQGLYLQT